MVRKLALDAPCNLLEGDRLEMEALIQLIPDDPRMFVRGLFMDGNLKRVRRQRTKADVKHVLRVLGDSRLHLFGKYPLESAIRFQNEVAVMLYGEGRLKHGITQISRDYFSAMMDTLAGKTLFGRAVSKKDVARVFEKTRKASETFAPYCGRDVKVRSKTELVFEVRQDFNYPSQVSQGLLEGILEFLGKEGTVRPQRIGPHDWDFFLQWDD